MSGETDLQKLLAQMEPQLHEKEYVFVHVNKTLPIKFEEIQGMFKEKEGTTLILKKELAEDLKLDYDYVASCITLAVHSSLEAVGLTAAFSTALANNNISCNVIAAYFHDHIFVDKHDATRAMEVLSTLSNANN
ncbi:ACT domain-containing protein [Flagellimonas nanhaiensis]|uniref:ACT domain-containing protein n=1 Tax=Flagellimonas nanhaiensis TaxID=2292706 RepID=A0A371JPI7_9FLAO|nr:ACT domain-containing protein [Allomuricauda nanhaiensis]RDY59435.1 ACT domain-containing protein [Allomuricauda nanhaiensis]